VIRPRCPKCDSKNVVLVGWAARVVDRQTRIDGKAPIKVMTTVPLFECRKCGHRWEEVKA